MNFRTFEMVIQPIGSGRTFFMYSLCPNTFGHCSWARALSTWASIEPVHSNHGRCPPTGMVHASRIGSPTQTHTHTHTWIQNKGTRALEFHTWSLSCMLWSQCVWIQFDCLWFLTVLLPHPLFESKCSTINQFNWKMLLFLLLLRVIELNILWICVE